MSKQVSFETRGNDTFLYELRKEVSLLFKEKKTTATPFVKIKALFLFSMRALIYLSILFGFYPFGFWPINWMVLGLTEITISINVGHDALHGAFAVSPTINRWLGYLAYDWIGLSSMVWKQTHNQEHHIFTNIHHVDPDITKPGVVRLCPHDTHYSFHRYQHVYMWPLYAIVGFNWVFVSDFVCYFQNAQNWKLSDRRMFFFWKVWALLYFIVIPTYLSPLDFWQVVAGYCLAQIVGGLTVSIIFQLAHVVEDVEYPLPDPKGHIATSWGEHEMRTTSNFATQNPLVTHFVGGLNFQIEHHLFPKISHGHYPKIQALVKKQAAKWNLPYYEKPTFKSAIISHSRVMKKLGRS